MAVFPCHIPVAPQFLNVKFLHFFLLLFITVHQNPLFLQGRHMWLMVTGGLTVCTGDMGWSTLKVICIFKGVSSARQTFHFDDKLVKYQRGDLGRGRAGGPLWGREKQLHTWSWSRPVLLAPLPPVSPPFPPLVPQEGSSAGLEFQKEGRGAGRVGGSTDSPNSSTVN